MSKPKTLTPATLRKAETQLGQSDRVMAKLIHTHDKASETWLGRFSGDSTVNRALFEDCRVRSGNPDMDEAEASKVIIEVLWRKVRETHRLRVVK